VLLHILDITKDSDPLADFEAINRELARFSPDLARKPQVVGVNKLDLPATQEKIKKEIDKFHRKGIEIIAFSAATGEGVGEAVKRIARELQTAKETASMVRDSRNPEP